MRRCVFAFLLTIVHVAARGKTKSTNASILAQIEACDTSLLQPSPSGLPSVPCGREDLVRDSICALLAMPPIKIKSSLLASARVYAERHAALTAHLQPKQGGQITEVGTLFGSFAKWLLKEFQPSNLTVMDVSLRALQQCRDSKDSTISHGRRYNSAVKCQWGPSAKLLKKLPDASQDLIYVDGDHEYKGVCADLESARSKVKIGGLLALNDYYRFEWQFLAQRGRWGAYGVIHAANEFIMRYQPDWELAYVTFGPAGEMGDFGMRRVR